MTMPPTMKRTMLRLPRVELHPPVRLLAEGARLQVIPIGNLMLDAPHIGVLRSQRHLADTPIQQPVRRLLGFLHRLQRWMLQRPSAQTRLTLRKSKMRVNACCICEIELARST